MGVFDTFNKVRRWGQHPGRMLGLGEGGWGRGRRGDGGKGGQFYIFSLLHVSEHSEHFCFWLFLVEKNNYFHGGGYPPHSRNLRPFS